MRSDNQIGGVLMNTCKTCEIQFKTEPFQHEEVDGFFCSMECLLEGTLDEPYALSYAFSMAFYIELTEDAAEISTTEDREELLDSIDEL